MRAKLDAQSRDIQQVLADYLRKSVLISFPDELNKKVCFIFHPLSLSGQCSVVSALNFVSYLSFFELMFVRISAMVFLRVVGYNFVSKISVTSVTSS